MDGSCPWKPASDRHLGPHLLPERVPILTSSEGAPNRSGAPYNVEAGAVWGAFPEVLLPLLASVARFIACSLWRQQSYSLPPYLLPNRYVFWSCLGSRVWIRGTWRDGEERGVERGCVIPRQMPSTQTLYGPLRCGLLYVVLHRSRPRRYPLRRLGVLAITRSFRAPRGSGSKRATWRRPKVNFALPYRAPPTPRIPRSAMVHVRRKTGRWGFVRGAGSLGNSACFPSFGEGARAMVGGMSQTQITPPPPVRARDRGRTCSCVREK